MKVKVIEKPYNEVINITPKVDNRIIKPNLLFRTLLKLVSLPELIQTNFKVTKVDMDKLDKKEVCLYLMNHSSFIDMKIAMSILYPKPVNIVATFDAFIGKNGLMRRIGCIPTKKFVSDSQLVRNIYDILKNKGNSVLLYPEAGYSFDGKTTTLPFSLAKFIKFCKVPVVMITTYGAYHRQPLYNNLLRRKVKTSAEMKYVLSKEDINNLNENQIYEEICKWFSFDNFKWQQENNIKISEKKRAEGLNRILYKCPHCNAEGTMFTKNHAIVCTNCMKMYELTEYGYLKAKDGNSKFKHIPDWYEWERECVKKEIESGTYETKSACDIYMMIDTYSIYKVGRGEIVHNSDGFHLTGCDGDLDYKQAVKASYSVNSDLYWYQIGDTVCIGDNKYQYYCFPDKKDVVVKMRLAQEELFKKL